MEFKAIQGKMEYLKAHLEVGLCHPIGNILVVVVDSNNLSLKRKIDFIDYMRTKTKPNNMNENRNQSLAM